MAITTWYRHEEREQMTKTSDSDINELLDEVNSKADNKILISERKIIPRRGIFSSLFSNPKPYFIYELFIHLGGDDCQVINFCQDHDWSINTHVRKSYIVTYLLGILSGLNRKTIAEPLTTTQ
jgi:hypothetical protein